MKILVLVKNVPDTETKIKLSAQAQIDASDFKYMVSPYDEFAIEEALQTQEKQGGGESVVVSLGPTRVQEAMRKALSMGIDRGVWVSTEGVSQEPDSFQVAYALAKVVAEEQPDVVFLGQKAIDDDAGHVGPMLAEILGFPHIQVVSKITWSDGGKKLTVEREVEGGMTEVYAVDAPAVLGAHKNLNTPRFPSLPGIMKAKKKTITEKKFADLCSEKPLVSASTFALPPEKAPGKVFKGQPVEDMVKTVVGLLRSEAKVI